AEDGIRYLIVTGVQTCALPISDRSWVKVEPENGGFVAMMPAKPDEQVDAKEKVTTHAYIAQLGRGLYVVSYGDYDASLHLEPREIGRASCRERVEGWGGDVAVK